MNLGKKNLILWLKKIFICTLGIFFLGLSGAINIKTALGADPITVFYEGLSKYFNLDLGLLINILNAILTLIVFLINRKYVHIGTVIYVLYLGIFVNFGIWAYEFLPIPNVFIVRLLISVLGCFIAYIGLGLYISIDIGVDPWSAISVIISKKINKSFRVVRFVQDIITLGIGWLAGGTVGIITVFAALIGGPVIQKSIELIDKFLKDMIKSTNEE